MSMFKLWRIFKAFWYCRQFKKYGYQTSIKFDRDYGINKRTGWTFIIEGVCPWLDGQFLPTPEDAVLWHVNDWIKSHSDWKRGPVMIYGEDWQRGTH